MIVYLRCRSKGHGWDDRVHAVVVKRETDTEWIGFPLNNPSCPLLSYPKFAWEEITR